MSNNENPIIPPPVLLQRCVIDYWEAVELAAAVLGAEEPCDDKATEAVEDLFVEQFGIDLNTFAEIAERLVPLCAMDKSPWTDEVRRGFVRNGAYIVMISTAKP